MTTTATHIEQLSHLAATGKPFVVVTLVESRGSAPQDAGAKMLVDTSGLVHGTVGGGKVEIRAIEMAQAILGDPSRNREIVDWNLQRDIGMTCGGLVKLYFEAYNRDNWSIVVFGAGHVAQALIGVLLTLNCRITCVDSRVEWIERLPYDRRLKTICSNDLTTEAAKLNPSDFVLCMTMGHSTDLPVLKAIFERKIELSFLGVIGSKTKKAALVRELVESGIPRAVAETFHCPVGLPIGSNQPAEIAISISAQMLQQRDLKRNSLTDL